MAGKWEPHFSEAGRSGFMKPNSPDRLASEARRSGQTGTFGFVSIDLAYEAGPTIPPYNLYLTNFKNQYYIVIFEV